MSDDGDRVTIDNNDVDLCDSIATDTCPCCGSVIIGMFDADDNPIAAAKMLPHQAVDLAARLVTAAQKGAILGGNLVCEGSG